MADDVARGYQEISRKLKQLKGAAGPRLVRKAASQSMRPAKKAAEAAAPVGNPPYNGKDPYPTRTYKGRLKTPGFARRNVAIKSKTFRDGTVLAMLGVRPEAFYAVQFIELGTSAIPKRPWLEPAFRSSINEVDSLFRQKLKDLLDKAAK